MTNYFELFGLPVTYELDLAALSQTYQELQRLTHPDRFADQGQQQQRIALQKNSLVSDGYSVLKSPARRAEHLLSLRGIELAGETQTMQDMDFLMQQMEWREMLADVTADSGEEVIEELHEIIEAQHKQLYQALQRELEQQSAQSDQAAADLLRKIKFIDKLHAEVMEKEEQFFS
ncbi:co-chaperone HscB [Alteromonas sp. ASW11-36]|uniref:Co-chaperone protein HscB homolog n=1 Tax=Alteromonas arenosi TaxID=3055817 RepID=A0ABT7SU22_9ALTE|nr:co-chaperone HscB [Alteromonas sp. ASW11-36]MDM7859690.1 co-chaperone HscB [Alteromonas sp. ASW11-36]